MRLGFAVSGLGHVAVVAVGLLVLAHPRLLDASIEPVTVEIVPENEIPPPEKEIPPQIRIELPSPGPTETRERQAADAPQPESPPKPETQKGAGGSSPPAVASAPPSPSAAWAAPPPAPSAPPQQQAAAKSTAAPPAAPPAAASTDAFAAAPLFMPNVVPSFDAFEFDTDAERGAKLTADAMTALQARLQQCWHPPASLASASKLRMTLRIALAPDGTLAREPLLIRASASAQGPRLVETATRALQECQPLGLPPDKYDEWKVLDLSFSPKGLM
jgi:hypothetical protein